MVDAPADGRRARQLRLPRRRRPGRRDAVHRVPDVARGRGDDRLDRREHRRLQAQLRQPRDRADRPSGGDPEPRRQRHDRHRGRHGHQHGAAQPGRGRERAAAPDHQAVHGPRRADALHPRPRPAHRWQDRGPRGHQGRLRDRPRHVPDAGDHADRDHRTPQGRRGHRAAVRHRHREGRRADQVPGADQEAAGHLGHQGPHRHGQRHPPGHRDQERFQPRRDPRAALPPDADGGVLRHQQRLPRRRPAPHAGPQGAPRPSSWTTATTSYAAARSSAGTRRPSGCTWSTACCSPSSTSTRSSR